MWDEITLRITLHWLSSQDCSVVKLPLLLDKGISCSALFRLLLFPEALTNCLFSARPCKIQILSVCVHAHTRSLPSLWRSVLNSPVAVGCYKQFSAMKSVSKHFCFFFFCFFYLCLLISVCLYGCAKSKMPCGSESNKLVHKTKLLFMPGWMCVSLSDV